MYIYIYPYTNIHEAYYANPPNFPKTKAHGYRDNIHKPAPACSLRFGHHVLNVRLSQYPQSLGQLGLRVGRFGP